VTVIYLELGDLIAIATRVLGLEVDAVLHITDLGLADSALARPQASFAGEEFYTEPPQKAAALLLGLARNHAFLDGNKRIALIATLQFLNLNGIDLDLDPAEEAYEVIAGAAAGDVTQDKLTEWIAARLRPWPFDD
jgi:death on curing protein